MPPHAHDRTHQALFDLRSPVERAARRQLVRRGHGGVGEDSDEEEEELKEEEEEGEDSEQEDEEEEEGDEPDLRTPPPRRRRPQIDRPLDRSREPALCKHSAASEPKPPSAVAGITIAAGSRARLQSVQARFPFSQRARDRSNDPLYPSQ